MFRRLPVYLALAVLSVSCADSKDDQAVAIEEDSAAATEAVEAAVTEADQAAAVAEDLSLIHISEPTRQYCQSRMPSSA